MLCSTLEHLPTILVLLHANGPTDHDPRAPCLGLNVNPTRAPRFESNLTQMMSQIPHACLAVWLRARADVLWAIDIPDTCWLALKHKEVIIHAFLVGINGFSARPYNIKSPFFSSTFTELSNG